MASVTEESKRIRTELKALGYSSRDVSVRSESYSMGSSIRVEVKSAKVDMGKVKAIAQPAESIRYCEFSGEILSGGNRYLHVEFDYNLVSSTAALILPIIPTDDGRSVAFGPYRIFRDPKAPNHARFVAYQPEQRNGERPRDHHCFTADELARCLARAWLESGADWMILDQSIVTREGIQP